MKCGRCKLFAVSEIVHPLLLLVLEHVFVSWGGGGGGVLGLIFAGYAPVASQSPYPIIVCSVANNRQICNFRDPNLVAFYFYELTHFFRLHEEHFAFHLPTVQTFWYVC